MNPQLLPPKFLITDWESVVRWRTTIASSLKDREQCSEAKDFSFSLWFPLVIFFIGRRLFSCDYAFLRNANLAAIVRPRRRNAKEEKKWRTAPKHSKYELCDFMSQESKNKQYSKVNPCKKKQYELIYSSIKVSASGVSGMEASNASIKFMTSAWSTWSSIARDFWTQND